MDKVIKEKIIMDKYTSNPEWNDDSIPNAASFQKINSGIGINSGNIVNFSNLFGTDGVNLTSGYTDVTTAKNGIDESFENHKAYLKREFDEDDTLENYTFETDKESLHYKIGDLNDQVASSNKQAEAHDGEREQLISISNEIKNTLNTIRLYLGERSFNGSYSCKTGDSDFKHIFPSFILEATLTLSCTSGNTYNFICDITKTKEKAKQYDGVETTFCRLPFYLRPNASGRKAKIVSQTGVTWWIFGRNCDIRQSGEIFIATLPTDIFATVRIEGSCQLDLNTAIPKTMADLYLWDFI